MKILLIEDDETMRKLLRTFLQLEGFEVATADLNEDPGLVIENIRAEKPQIVVMDVFLGRLNGFDLLSAIRRDENLSDLGIIMSSGADFYGQCLAAGADTFLMKPYMPDDLVQKIHEITTIEKEK